MNHPKEFYEATDISSSCFVFASAGSGKTKILVDRYIKSMFFGIDPKDILCITFTNAAVYEMETRISNILEKLYLNNDNFTEVYLNETLNIAHPAEDDIKKAEELFFKFQDSLSQLKILTIHSFCQSLLQQFPLESNISPNFRIMDESEALKLVQQAKDLALKKVSIDNVENLSKLISIKTLEDFVEKIYFVLPNFVAFFKKNPSIDDYKQLITELFNVKPPQDFSLEHQKFIDEFFKNRNLEEVYLTQNGTLRKRIPFSDNRISRQIAEIVLENLTIRKKEKTIDKTCAFLEVVKGIIDEYQKLKESENVLDFSDVLYKTKFLLTESCAKDFVSSRICARLKSIMIDEAQDLSPIQWELISLISDDVYSDLSSEKTIFVVGDIKQSIYRFQGADCRLLSEFYEKTSGIFKRIGKPLKTVYLNTSYRTLPKILNAVDEVFYGDIAKTFLDNNVVQYKRHILYRKESSGKFEVLHFENDENLTSKIVEKITELKTEDSLILTRSRNELSEQIIAGLSSSGIEVAPPDRVKLNDSLLVMDLLAVADVCIDKNNDYAICCVLKSPHIFEEPLTNDDLFELCHNRTKSVLENLEKKFPEKYLYFNGLVNGFDANDLDGFFYKLILRLHNMSSSDRYALEGFLDEVTKFSKNKTDDINEFLSYFRTSDIEITNRNISKNAIRLSTIHGSKGLEAKTVFLLDFDLTADKAKTKFLFSNDLFFIKPSEKEAFHEINPLVKSEYDEEEKELLRLLYVAMTRPRDDLFILTSNPNNRKTAATLVEAKLWTKS